MCKSRKSNRNDYEEDVVDPMPMPIQIAM